MLILLHCVRALDIQPLELIVVSHLVAGRDLEGSDRDNLAVDLNRTDREDQSVDLHEVLGRRLDDLLALRYQLVLDLFSIISRIWLHFLVNNLLYEPQTQDIRCAYIRRL